jgi:hypothetical protein
VTGRINRRLTGWLALLALALQLAASFGHIHAEDFAGLGRAAVAQTALADNGPAGAPDPDHLTCDICAAVHLAGSLLMPAPPVLVVPASAPVVLTLPAPVDRLALAAAAFHARGPPQA